MDPHTGVLPSLKVMVDRSARWKFSWQQSPLAACPQEVKDGVEDGTKVGGARSPTRSRRRQNWRNPGPRRVGRVGVVESRVHRTVPLTRVSALSRQTSTFQTPSNRFRKQLFKFGATGAQPLDLRVFAVNVLTIRLIDGI